MVPDVRQTITLEVRQAEVRTDALDCSVRVYAVHIS